MKRMIAISFALVLLISGCEKKEQKKEAEVEAPAKITITEGAVKEQKAQKKSLDKGEFYYSYQEKKEAQITEDEGKYTKLGAYRNVLNNYQKVQISLWANKLSKDFLIYCSACHDDYANGVIGPSLLDKDGDFIYKQLQDFKSGKRKNVLMVQLVRKLSDEKLKAIADEVAAFNKKVQKLLKDHAKDSK